jgi:AraC-like DNA-binding protein
MPGFRKKFLDTLHDEKWLTEHYIDRCLTLQEIADEAGASSSAVFEVIQRLPKEIRIQRERPKQRGSSAPRPRGKFLLTLHSKEWLKERFVDRKLTMTEMARQAGSSVPSVQRALRQHLGIKSAKRPSKHSEKKLAGFRARAKARQLHYVDRVPCIICGKSEVTLNHIDANPENNDKSNVEWLCHSHHLMVDKRLAGKAVRWFRKRHMSLWMKWHKEVLAELQENPDPLPR